MQIYSSTPPTLQPSWAVTEIFFLSFFWDVMPCILEETAVRLHDITYFGGNCCQTTRHHVTKDHILSRSCFTGKKRAQGDVLILLCHIYPTCCISKEFYLLLCLVVLYLQWFRVYSAKCRSNHERERICWGNCHSMIDVTSQHLPGGESQG